MPAPSFRSLIALVLAVSLTAMGLAAASARGQTRAEGRVMVLCSGGGPVQVALGEDGSPTGESHLCPDLAASLLASAQLALPEVARPTTFAVALEAETVSHSTFPARAISRARGPPVPA
ncbi:hypothetical protein [Albidovulum sp.]|uniref:hypothetical protein n=1 Tax=Albidovulum sp. TaxID=1872424 RepID=UPI0039B893E8